MFRFCKSFICCFIMKTLIAIETEDMFDLFCFLLCGKHLKTQKTE